MPAAGQVPDDGSGEVRVLHWNIHSWRDESGAPNTGAVIELISRTKPHAVSLVEVDETWSAPVVLPPCCSSSLALFATGYVAMTRHITNAGAFYKAHMFARTCVTLPLPGEILEVLQNYLRLERPLTNSPYLFISLKGRRRGQPMTPVWTPLAIPPSSIAEHGSFRQSAPISTYFRSGHGARGHLLTRPPAPHGSCADSHHHALCPTGAPGHLARDRRVGKE